MTKKQKEKVFQMRESGKSYQEIANKIGVSKQYIHAFINYSKPKKYCYPKIEEWMRKNDVTLKDLSGLIDLSIVSLSRKLHGYTKFNMDEIERILLLTGLSFEVCFARKEG